MKSIWEIPLRCIHANGCNCAMSTACAEHELAARKVIDVAERLLGAAQLGMPRPFIDDLVNELDRAVEARKTVARRVRDTMNVDRDRRDR